jgi:hypothetical protein
MTASVSMRCVKCCQVQIQLAQSISDRESQHKSHKEELATANAAVLAADSKLQECVAIQPATVTSESTIYERVHAQMKEQFEQELQQTRALYIDEIKKLHEKIDSMMKENADLKNL